MALFRFLKVKDKNNENENTKQNEQLQESEEITIRFHYKRKNDDYKDWNFWVWERDREGNDKNEREVNFDETEDSFGKVVTVKVNKKKGIKKLGFIARRAEKDNDWAEKDIEDDRFIPLKKKNKEVDVYVVEGEKTYFLDKNKALKFIEDKNHKTVNQEKKEKVKIKIHYRRYDKDYEYDNGNDIWKLWVWEKDSLGFEGNGSSHDFSKVDKYGRYAEFYIEKGENLTDLGIRVYRGNWTDKDIDMNRYIPVSKIDENGNIEAYLLQEDDKIAYKRADVEDLPKILKAHIEDKHRIFAILNYCPVNMDDFKVVDGDKELKVERVTEVAHKTYEIVTKDELSVKNRYTLLKGGYKEKQISIEKLYDTEEFKKNFVYDGNDLGLTYTKEMSKFKVWAPVANSVKLCLYEKGIGGKCLEEINMKPSEKGTWELDVNKDLYGCYYTYKVDNYGKEMEAVDPYAKAVGANGERGAVIDLKTTNPKEWSQDVSPNLNHIEDSIIYEAHVRDITIDKNSGVKYRGKFLGLTEENTKSIEGEKTGLSHLKDLGVTHLHLLPIFDFSGVNERSDDGKTYNWGYNPENYNVPEGSYSTNANIPEVRIEECKEAIHALHKNNIRVIMDVVYNHTAKTEDSNFNKIVPGYYHRKRWDGSYSNGSGCGNEVSSEREMTKKMIIDSLKYWVKEYHVDGFRFDLMGLHDINLMNDIRKEMDNINPKIILYGEGWTAMGTSTLPYDQQARRENARQLDRIGTFNDVIRDAIKGSNSEEGEREPGFANGAFGKEDLIRASVVAAVRHYQINNNDKVDEPIQTINYASAHDNLTLWDKINCTNRFDREEERIKIDKLSAAIVMTSQGIPFIHGGEEFLRTKQGVHNSYESSDEINKFDWYRKTKYIDVNNYYKRLIALRKEHPAFRMTNSDDIRKNLHFMDNIHIPNVVGYTIRNNANGDNFSDVAVIFNANANKVQVTLPEGKWAMVLDGRKGEIRELECVKDNRIWIDGITAVVLADAPSVEKELERKEKERIIKREEKKEKRRKEREQEKERKENYREASKNLEKKLKLKDTRDLIK